MAVTKPGALAYISRGTQCAYRPIEGDGTVNEENSTRNFNANTESTPRTEEFSVSGEDIVAKVRELVHEGNVRRIIIKDANGNTMIEFPLTAGLIGVAILPVYAAIGAAVALAANCTILVERRA
jgi:Flp pilus assembly pilin Flp